MLKTLLSALIPAFLIALILLVSHPITAAAQPALPPPADADGDGLPDAWETQYGLNPRVRRWPQRRPG